jgi:hypothetical protein
LLRGFGSVGRVGRRTAANELGERTIDLRQVAGRARALAGQEFGGDRADCVQVLPWVRVGAGELFGCQVPGGSEDRAVASHPWLVDQARDAEVGQPKMRPTRTRDVEQKVGGFHIAMDDTRGVNGR